MYLYVHILVIDTIDMMPFLLWATIENTLRNEALR